MTLHQELKIIRGVAKAEGDTASAELGLSVLDLMDSGAFTLEADGWQPQIAAFEGVYAESTIVTGRTLLAGREQNITESIRLTAVADTYPQLYERIKRLEQMAQDARRFWTHFGEIEPVYLKWHALCAPGPQYALIYNINSDVRYADYAQSPRVDVTLTVEREPYWREIAPGAYPVRVVSSGTLGNDHAFEAGEESTKRRNYLDVDDVPGDAPALMMLSMAISAGSTVDNMLYVGHSARSKTVRNRTPDANVGTNILRYNLMNAPASFGGAAALTGSDASLAADTGGVMQKGASTTRYRVEVDFATYATEQGRVLWNSNDGGNAAIQTFDWTRHQGRYACFLRMRQVGGAFGDITVRVGIGSGELNPLLYSTGETVSPLVSGTSGNTVFWPLTYAGVLTIPPIGKGNSVRSDGLGLAAGIGALSSAQSLAVYAARSTGSGELYLCDLVLMPLDNWLLGAPYTRLNVDNTGYHAHAQTGTVVHGTFETTVPLPEVRGPEPYLMPGENRLYGIYFAENTASAAATFTLSVRYVPRWRGVRDA